MLRVDAALTGTDRDPCTALGQTPQSQRASVLGHTYRNRNLSGEIFPLSWKEWVVAMCVSSELDHVEKQDNIFSCSPTSSAQETANCLLFFIFLHIILKGTYNH